MQYPIIEIRESNLFVLDEFEGQVSESEVKRPFNYQRNLTKFVIDSVGEVWEFQHKSHNHNGHRKLISILWNVSFDIYSYQKKTNKNVDWLRGVLNKYTNTENPDINEMAEALIKDIDKYEGSVLLSKTVINGLGL